ncbi:hypothetical protein PISMIDRAFT_13849 [Pisolithus microcarpus 441]|uniref:MIF4G domain-containing protein n=1 Tax=Pisolithus microcarpus 441 TaxID=765257 RepID=A0A0C9ZGR1_9AGAM|nr:hypothetical protein PISMIDRAFT_13849 [Pisolithus microcarpus 441]
MPFHEGLKVHVRCFKVADSQEFLHILISPLSGSFFRHLGRMCPLGFFLWYTHPGFKLIYEKAVDEDNRSYMYTRLCHEMMETINPKVQDDGIKNAEGKPITGGQLFCRYLLHRCQEDFEHGWVAEEATARAAAAKASGDEAIKGRRATRASHILTSTMWLRRRNLPMLTERIMHECVKKLLGNMESPKEEEQLDGLPDAHIAGNHSPALPEDLRDTECAYLRRHRLHSLCRTCTPLTAAEPV